LEIPPEDAGAFHLHHDTPLEYAKEMVAEYYDEKVQAWVCPEGRANHYWDCEVLALAAAYILGIRNWKRKSGDKSVLKAKKAAPHPSLITNRPNWLGGMR
jgi:phage terminase large subunit GpA-like protein